MRVTNANERKHIAIVRKLQQLAVLWGSLWFLDEQVIVAVLQNELYLTPYDEPSTRVHNSSRT